MSELFIVPIQPMERMAFSDAGEAPAAIEGSSFRNYLKQAVAELVESDAVSQQDGRTVALGQTDDIAQVQINSFKAEAMLQTTVQVTTRLVSAYKEIMQMQI